jgi:putative transcriptional regulator
MNLDLKPGRVIIARQFFNNELLRRSVILILEHDETGTTGVILNKAKFISQTVPLFGKINELLYGGNYDSHRIGFIHKIKDLAKTIRISDELYYNHNCLQLQRVISEGEKDAKQVKAFMGFTVWAEGLLEKEIRQNKWWVDDFNISELDELKGKDLWEEKLIKAGNMYAMFCSMSDPGLN